MTTDTSSATAAPPDPDESPDSNSLAVLASTAPVGNGIGDYTRNYLSRLRGGDMGSLPAITGLVVLIILFGILQPSFASLYNTAVLLTEGSGPIVIAMGLVFVLLLGEIDLSAGYA
ncbi:MAG: ABC transporter permease, partial [Jatrophihabitantaceae bacterium]